MPAPDRKQHVAGLLLAAAVVAWASGCAAREPNSTIKNLNWACGPARCTANFRVANDTPDDEAVVVLVRAYAGESVASRRIVGQHRERLSLRAGGSKRLDVAIDTTEPASRLRVILEAAE